MATNVFASQRRGLIDDREIFGNCCRMHDWIRQMYRAGVIRLGFVVELLGTVRDKALGWYGTQRNGFCVCKAREIPLQQHFSPPCLRYSLPRQEHCELHFFLPFMACPVLLKHRVERYWNKGKIRSEYVDIVLALNINEHFFPY